jgi:4-hydroxy-4-methyl-2-oxoglutarate aldolase
VTALDATRSSQLLELGTATLYEASGIDCDLDPALRPSWPGARHCGPALTVRTGAADNLALHLALERADPGDVVVADARGLACGYWGEVLAVAAQVRGVAGLVIDGGLRDVDRLAELGFPAFSRFVAVRRTQKEVLGDIGGSVVVGGRTIARGDVIIADADGVVVLPRDRVEEISAAGAARVVKEERLLERIRAGETTPDLYGLRQ